jgi:hypothetical protein
VNENLFYCQFPSTQVSKKIEKIFFGFQALEVKVILYLKTVYTTILFKSYWEGYVFLLPASYEEHSTTPTQRK